MNLPTKQKYSQTENSPVTARGKMGWFGNLRLAEANYCIQDRETARSYCIAQGTIFNILDKPSLKKNIKKEYIYIVYIKYVSHIYVNQLLCCSEEINTQL